MLCMHFSTVFRLLTSTCLWPAACTFKHPRSTELVTETGRYSNVHFWHSCCGRWTASFSKASELWLHATTSVHDCMRAPSWCLRASWPFKAQCELFLVKTGASLQHMRVRTPQISSMAKPSTCIHKMSVSAKYAPVNSVLYDPFYKHCICRFCRTHLLDKFSFG